jgi:hypothetical protein
VLSPHTLLVAAIFVPYMIMMGALFAYICHTGTYRPGQRDEDVQQDAGSDDEDPDLLLAA